MNDIILPTHGHADPMLGNTSRPKRHFSGSPRDILFVLFWHRKKVVGFFVVATILTALAVLALPSTYRSESKLLVKMGSDTVNPDVSATFGGPMVTPVMYWEVQMKTELELLKSRDIAQAVVDSLGAGRILRKSNDIKPVSREDPLNKQALTALQTNLQLEVVPDSSILSIAYESSDERLARDIAAAYVDRYLSLRSYVHGTQAGADFLKGQHDETLVKVAELEEQVRKIKDDAGVGNIDESRQILQNRIGAMQSDASGSHAQAIAAAAEVSAIESRLKDVPERIVTQQTKNGTMNWVDELKKDISKLEADLADANARFVPNSPQVRIIEDKLRSARNSLAAAGESGEEKVLAMNPVYQDLQRALETARTTANVAKAKETAVREEIAKADTQLKTLNDVEVKIKSLLRAANLKEDTLHLISQANDRAALLAKLQGDKLNNVTVVQPASLPLRPVAPNRLMLLVLGMFVAGTGAVGLGLASESLSRSAKRPEDIDRLSGLPCVSVPVIESQSFFGNGANKPAGKSLLKLLPGATEPKQTLVTRSVGTSGPMIRSAGNGTTDIRPVRRWSPQLLQAAHGIIDGLLFDSIRMAKHQSAFVTGLVSCRPGQGASTLSAYVASAIADRLEASLPLHPDDRVLLVDGDLSEPALHRLLSIEDSPGLGDWLSISHVDAPAISEFVHPTNHARLSVMPSGRTSSLTRLLDRMDLLVDETTRQYRHMVIDLPPVSTTPTALRLAAKCNAVLLVVECGNLHQEVVRKSVRALQAAGANVAGVVLNKRRFPIPDWLYERAA